MTTTTTTSGGLDGDIIQSGSKEGLQMNSGILTVEETGTCIPPIQKGIRVSCHGGGGGGGSMISSRMGLEQDK